MSPKQKRNRLPQPQYNWLATQRAAIARCLDYARECARYGDKTGQRRWLDGARSVRRLP